MIVGYYKADTNKIIKNSQNCNKKTYGQGLVVTYSMQDMGWFSDVYFVKHI